MRAVIGVAVAVLVVGVLALTVPGMALGGPDAAEPRPPAHAGAPGPPAHAGEPGPPDHARGGEKARGPKAAEDRAAKAERRAGQQAFVAAKREWTACVREEAPDHDESTGPFDPEAACGEKPTPRRSR